jgi:nitroreductase
MGKLPPTDGYRQPDQPIERLMVQRWSPRAMSGEPLRDDELLALFEAARWAPSTFNEQEWRFLFARRGSSWWDTFFGLLSPGNQEWCHRAAVLVVVLSHKVFTRDGSPNPVHTFDAGLATQNLFLQAAAMGLVAHGLAGFDREKTRRELGVPEDYEIEAMVALGRPGDPGDLPQRLLDRERPSERKPVSQIVREGDFDFPK